VERRTFNKKMRLNKKYKLGLMLALIFGSIGSMPFVVFAKEGTEQFIGEKIVYTIKKFGITAGTATLTFVGPAEKDGKNFALIVFHADGMNFFDNENIFADPETLLPRIVVRDLNIFGKKEKITEDYVSQKGAVRITKIADGKTTEQILKKDGEVDNIYCFISRYRRDGNFETGDSLKINLPTTDVQIKMEQKTSLSADGQKIVAFFMQSDPAKYKIWFGTDNRNIPLRIDGAAGFGNTSMIMKEYQGNSAAGK